MVSNCGDTRTCRRGRSRPLDQAQDPHEGSPVDTREPALAAAAGPTPTTAGLARAYILALAEWRAAALGTAARVPAAAAGRSAAGAAPLAALGDAADASCFPHP